jgi:hypothetical protein
VREGREVGEERREGGWYILGEVIDGLLGIEKQMDRHDLYW